ncbi:succinyl-diaminopimelate desuccinylase [Actinotalea ferrariae CF5-4]|uniref:Succinyl-diaminopimelate desuccinylase n=1 Tax=Actinotalea ferrariae CF5-4 TaxID=948458 RepID=A0A021VXV0_9CELL|nr:succinyl-diaminopimelate desuccinylase [Actinotalea ferrariae]EYR63882.1 succinyl-diaminopimelate desuccinylase [Actinotalea ferrariae CF5-4]
MNAAPPTTPALDLTSDVLALTRALCDVPSVSGDETRLADLVETALRALPHLEVLRDGDAVMARTHLGRAERVVVAGHLDTVPVAANLPTRLLGEGAAAELWGRGTVDMKGGVAVQLACAAAVTEPVRDVTWVFYDHEEVASELNGLGRLVRHHPEWLRADLAVLCEPTSGAIEGGCNGTLRVEVTLPGRAAHSARAWRGVNAIHAAAPLLQALADHPAEEVEVDGLTYRESLSAVLITGGIATNVVPDRCVVTVNYRFAPALSPQEAVDRVRALVDGLGIPGAQVEVTDLAPGARPGLDHPAAAAFAATVQRLTGRTPAAKVGWTDVARFAELGVPAVNFGPGDPSLAHADDERCPVADLDTCFFALRTWLTEPTG